MNKSFPDYRVLGVRVNALTIPDLHDVIRQAVERSTRCIIVSQNLHSVYVQRNEPKLRRMQELATFVRIDGIPLVYFGKALGLPLSASHRTGWMDWIDPFMHEAVAQKWRVFYLGSKPDTVRTGAEVLRSRFPDLQLETHHGYFDATPGSDDNTRVLELINSYRADVLIVGMGMPRQESWILENMDRIDSPVILTSGACMDYVAGDSPVPPRWLGPLGLEWAYRLASDPKRLWRRYLVEPWYSLKLFAKDLSRHLTRPRA